MKNNTKHIRLISFCINVILHLSLGVIVYAGGFSWVIRHIKDTMRVTYAGYAMAIILIALFSEIWVILVSIPNIKDYDSFISAKLDILRVVIGMLIIAMSLVLLLVYVNEHEKEGSLHKALSRSMYNASVKNKNYNELLQELDEIIEREGANSEFFTQRGDIYFNVAKYKAGWDNSESIPDEWLPDISANTCYEYALNNYNDAINLDDTNSYLYFMRGMVMFHDSTSSYADAKESFEQALAINEEDTECLFYASQCWLKLAQNNYKTEEKMVEKAIDYAEKAVKLHEQSFDDKKNFDKEKYAQYLFQLGTSFLYYAEQAEEDVPKKTAIKNAINALSMALQNKDNDEYYTMLGQAYIQEGSEDSLYMAIDSFESAIEINKKELNYETESINYAWKGYVYEILGDHGKVAYRNAENAYLTAIELNKDYKYAYSKLAKHYRDVQNYRAAIEIYKKAIKQCSANDRAEFYYERGECYYSIEDYYAAINDFFNALKCDYSDKRVTYWYIAAAYYVLEDYEQAYNNYQHAIDNGLDETQVKIFMDICREKIG